MRYVIEITQKQADKITKLINEAKYQSVAQFILTAIENQIYLEESEGPSQPVFYKPLEINSSFVIKEEEHDKVGHPVIDIEVEPSLIAAINNNPKTLPLPRFEELACSIKKGKAINEEYAWLWGQVNRIFPVKLGLRVLLGLLGNGEIIELEIFKNKAGNVALAYGKMIRSRERYENKPRDERVSAGLPIDITDSKFREAIAFELRKSKRIDEIDSYLQQEEFKSTNRYKAHFLALIRKDEKFEGAMSYLKFVNFKKLNGEKIYIGLTKEGLEFAKLKNPIIDEKNFEKSLSDSEINFYLDHISKNVKGEKAAIEWLLRKINEGIIEREKIIQEITKEFNQFWNDSKDVINTQRAGLMARMFELGLINKRKEGISVTYSISDRGRKFLDKTKRM